MSLYLKPESFDWALEHAERFGDTDIFPPAFEFEALRHTWTEIRQELVGADVLSWTTRPHRYCLVPKGRYGFRIATQLDPLDFLVYAAIVYEIGEDLENHRVPPGDGVVFSYRFAPDSTGRLYEPGGYARFLDRCRELVETHAGYVAVTDISDFYSRLYHHPLENALAVATRYGNHVQAVMRLLRGWNQSVSYGIPVGNAPSRILAEAAIADIDAALCAAGIPFARFNDDYRIFAESRAKAYKHVAFLAQMLHDNHGLSLQPQKTDIVDPDGFERRFLRTHREQEANALKERFNEFVESLGLDTYEPVDPQDLDEGQKAELASMNLGGMLRDEIGRSPEPDIALIQFVLRRMAQISSPDLVSDVLDSIEVLHPILPDVVRYLVAAAIWDEDTRSQVGDQLLSLFKSSIVSELEFHRAWLLVPFATSTDWGNSSSFYQLLGHTDSSFARRKLILAMGRACQDHWFKSSRKRVMDEGPWARRALLMGASCIAKDSRKAWYRSIESKLDLLEKAVMTYALDHPFRK
jgi:hypothetical protein